MIVDASIAVKWFLDEDRFVEARSLLGSDSLNAPQLIRIEVTHVLWRAVKRGRLESGAFSSAMQVMDKVFEGAASTDALIARSIALTTHLNHPVYDCLYIALAEREAAVLVTADERQFSAARRAKVPARLL